MRIQFLLYSAMCVRHLAFWVLLLLGTSSCGPLVQSRGQAVTYGSGAFKTTKLPLFSIGKRGSHEFAVEALEARAFPYSLRIHSRRYDDPYVPRDFEHALLRLEILDYDSRKTLATRLIRPTRWTFEGLGEYEKIFFEKGQPAIANQANYRVRVTVIEPSLREFDKARLMLR